MLRRLHYTKLAIFTLAAMTLAACASSYPKESGGDANLVEVIAVTPEVVSQQQQELYALHHATDAAAPVETPYNYRLGAGDILFAKLYIPSSLSFDGANLNQQVYSDNWQQYNEVIVKDDGNVSFPYVGEIPFGDKTLSEAKQALDTALARYFKNPQSVLEIKEFKSRKVQLTGEFHKPGEQNLRYVPLHVLEAIDAAGGLLDTADIANATITHKDGSIEKLDLFALINNGDTSQNRILYDGDTLQIPANHGNKVFVMGEVNRPTLQYIKAGHMTVMEAMNTSMGLNYVTASYSRIYVIRGIIQNISPPMNADDPQLCIADTVSLADEPALSDAPDDPETAPPPAAGKSATLIRAKVYQLDGTTGSGLAMAAQFPLQSNDIVYVSSTPISDWNRFVSLLLPFNAINAVGTVNGFNGL